MPERRSLLSQNRSTRNSNVLILYGTVGGLCREYAEETAKWVRKGGFQPEVLNMRDYSIAQLQREKRSLLIITNTWGKGRPPKDAKCLWREIKELPAGSLKDLNHAVLAVGHSHFQDRGSYCQFGSELGQYLQALGSKPLAPIRICGELQEEHKQTPHFEKLNGKVQGNSEVSPDFIKWLDQLPSMLRKGGKKELSKERMIRNGVRAASRSIITGASFIIREQALQNNLLTKTLSRTPIQSVISGVALATGLFGLVTAAEATKQIASQLRHAHQIEKISNGRPWVEKSRAV